MTTSSRHRRVALAPIVAPTTRRIPRSGDGDSADSAESADAGVRAGRPPSGVVLLRGLAAGALAGAGWGVIARVFMRLLTDDPGFSWSGTLFILGLSTAAGALVGLVRAALRSGGSGWWRLAVLPALALFAGPGFLLAPAALGTALVLRGRAPVRVAGLLLVASAPVLLVTASGEATPTTAQVAGFALFLLSAVPLGWAVGEVLRRRPRRAAVRGARRVDPVAGQVPAAAG